MVLETRCNRCDKHIGYISMTDLPGDGSDCLKTIVHAREHMRLEMICDNCRDGVVNIGGEDYEPTD